CILGDINCDGIVDIRDYGLWRANFGQTNCGNPADLDGTCIVDIRDYGIWRANFGHTAGAAARGSSPGAPPTSTATPIPPTRAPLTPAGGAPPASAGGGSPGGFFRQAVRALGRSPPPALLGQGTRWGARRPAALRPAQGLLALPQVRGALDTVVVPVGCAC